ncbi:hypothetical protein T484DRAFT_1919305, partial [Baffinella frigidus]
AAPRIHQRYAPPRAHHRRRPQSRHRLGLPRPQDLRHRLSRHRQHQPQRFHGLTRPLHDTSRTAPHRGVDSQPQLPSRPPPLLPPAASLRPRHHVRAHQRSDALQSRASLAPADPSAPLDTSRHSEVRQLLTSARPAPPCHANHLVAIYARQHGTETARLLHHGP